MMYNGMAYRRHPQQCKRLVALCAQTGHRRHMLTPLGACWPLHLEGTTHERQVIGMCV